MTEEQQCTIGMLLGSRDSSGALVDPLGQVLARVSVPNADSPQDGVEGLVAMARSLTRRAERLGVAVAGVGVGFPGVVDPADGAVRGTRLALGAWRGVALQADLVERLGLPVCVRNDAVSILIAEAAAGCVVGERSVVLAYSSTGVGGALMLEGAIMTGRRGAAGHLGHIPSAAAAGIRCSCGAIGHLDPVASAAGMTNWYREQRHLSPGDAPYLRVVAQAAEQGDVVAQEALARGGAALGTALGGVANLLEPDVIVLAGESAANAAYRSAAMTALAAEIIPGGARPDVRVSQLGGDAQVIGAALGALSC
jgi:glucokinase